MGSSKVSFSFLGKSGLKVSNMCLGTMTFGKRKESQYYNYPTQLKDQESTEILNKFVELGGNFIDTANFYGFGHSEEIVGQWLKTQDRSQIVVATKARFRMDANNKNSEGLSRRNLVESCEASLRRLQTDYIDLYQAHMWDDAVPIEETLRTYDDLVRSGKIRYYGFSNVCGWQLQKIADVAKYMGLNPCITLQQQYNLLIRYPEFEELRVCQNENIAVMAWSPLKGGLLTGKFLPDRDPSTSDSRIGYISANEHRSKESAPAWSEFANNEKYWEIIETLSHIASKHGKTIPQVALRWVLQKEVVASAIIGATSLKQLEENMAASGGWGLSSDEMEELDRVSSPELRYPHTMILPNNRGRQNVFNR